MSKEEYLDSITKQDVLNAIGWYLLEHKDIPNDITPEDIWGVITDLFILETF